MTTLSPEDKKAIQANNWRAKRIIEIGEIDEEARDLLDDILHANYEVLDTSTPTHIDNDTLPNPDAPKPPTVKTTSGVSPVRGKFGLFVGHNAYTGASSIDGSDEHLTREKVATLAAEKLNARGIVTHVLYRDGRLGYTSAMRKHGETAKKLDLDGSLELHFNAYDGSAKGAELLVASKSTEGTLGKAFVDATLEFYPNRTLRGGGVKLLRGGRGYGFNQHQPCPSGVYEPFFGDSTEWYEYDDEIEQEADYIVRIVENFFENVRK